MRSFGRGPGRGGALRILLVCGALRPEADGVADYVVRLAAALRSGGAVVRITHTGGPSAVPGTRSAGRRWSAVALLRAAGWARGADAVHVQFAPSMYRFRIGVGLLPLLLGSRPLITTLHEYGWWRWEQRLPERIWEWLERARTGDRETLLLVPRSRAVVTTNDAHAAAVAARFPRAPRTTIVPIGANVGLAVAGDDRTAARAELGARTGTTVLAFFGFVHPVKGIRYLAEATAELVAEGRDVRLAVIGGFESTALPAAEARAFEAELRGAIAAAGVRDRTVLTGFLPADRVSRLLNAADVAVLPFTAGVSGKSGSLLTVLAHRLPTVVTGGLDPDPELLDGDRVVVVPEVRDGAALARGIRRVLNDPELAERVADRGARWAAEHDWDEIARAHLDLYREVRR